MYHLVLLPFWGTVHPEDGLMHNSPELLQAMRNYHPLMVLYAYCISDNILIKETQNKSVLEALMTGQVEWNTMVSVQRSPAKSA